MKFLSIRQILFVLAFCLYGLPQIVVAQVYLPDSREALIGYHYGLIYQLQNNHSENFSTFNNQFVNQQIGRSVSSDYSVEVQTFEANNNSNDEAWIWGGIDLNGAPYATVWFQYGENRNFGEETRRGRIDLRTSDSFRGELEDLDEDETYYFRAVAEDPVGYITFGKTLSFSNERSFSSSRSRSQKNDDDIPEVDTNNASDIDENSAELRGFVEMNDFNNGLVFFIYGEDEDAVDEVETEDEFGEIDEDGDDLQKFIVDRDLDDDSDFNSRVADLDQDTDYYFRICVEYEDEDDGETLECGGVEDFQTDD